MLKSMTGFGRCEEVIEGYAVQLQIKSVNHRYSDFTIKTPRRYSFLEDTLRRLAVDSIARGKVEILLSMEKENGDDQVVSLDRAMAEGYLEALRGMKEYGLKDDLTLTSMVGFHDLFRTEQTAEDEELLVRVVTEAFQMAHGEFVEMRRSEGTRLEESLKGHLAALLEEVTAIEGKSAASVEAYRERLRSKLQEILEDKQVETRVVSCKRRPFLPIKLPWTRKRFVCAAMSKPLRRPWIRKSLSERNWTLLCRK